MLGYFIILTSFVALGTVCYLEFSLLEMLFNLRIPL